LVKLSEIKFKIFVDSASDLLKKSSKYLEGSKVSGNSKFRIKLDSMSVLPNDKNKFPIYYLPFKKEDGLLAGPKPKKGDKKEKKKKKK